MLYYLQPPTNVIDIDERLIGIYIYMIGEEERRKIATEINTTSNKIAQDIYHDRLRQILQAIYLKTGVNVNIHSTSADR